MSSCDEVQSGAHAAPSVFAEPIQQHGHPEMPPAVAPIAEHAQQVRGYQGTIPADVLLQQDELMAQSQPRSFCANDTQDHCEGHAAQRRRRREGQGRRGKIGKGNAYGRTRFDGFGMARMGGKSKGAGKSRILCVNADKANTDPKCQ